MKDRRSVKVKKKKWRTLINVLYYYFIRTSHTRPINEYKIISSEMEMSDEYKANRLKINFISYCIQNRTYKRN